jgi:hypothetical protein
MQAAKDAEEERLRREAEEIERESQLVSTFYYSIVSHMASYRNDTGFYARFPQTGVAGKAAFFKRQATTVGTDVTKSNEEKVLVTYLSTVRSL